MRVLLLAPHPFYQERGTPIAVDLLLRALSEREYEVDVLTFHEGSDREYRGVRIFRIKPLLKVRGIRPGLSAKKIFCDVHMAFKLVSLLRKERYDIVHAIEESAFLALAACPIRKMPFVYDMDSSMTTQIVDKVKIMRPFRGMLQLLETLPMRFAAAVLPMCDALAETAAKAGAKDIVVLKDISLLEQPGRPDVESPLRQQMELPKNVAMYIGNLESYQGIDLMLESFALVRKQRDDVALVIIGGAADDVEKYKSVAEDLGVGEHVHFLGRRPVKRLYHYMTQADILISPRTQGVNTPMKVYSYLDSGVPVLATDLPTHTQVMTSDTAMLAPPESEQFAQAMLRLLGGDELRSALAAKAKRLIKEEHSYDAFKRKLYGLYDRLERGVRGEHSGS